MFLVSNDNILKDPKSYIDEIFDGEFFDFEDGEKVFRNIQARKDDEFSRYVLSVFPDYDINHNFIRVSPLNQVEPNFIHKDDMMGDVTCILYLSKKHPEKDGTTIYDDNDNPICCVYSKYNRMVSFNSDAPHSRNIFENFGEGRESRLIQVIFLKKKI
jgi:hypothetical protein